MRRQTLTTAVLLVGGSWLLDGWAPGARAATVIQAAQATTTASTTTAVTTTTLGRPVPVLAPPSLTVRLSVGATSLLPVTVRNDGNAPLAVVKVVIAPAGTDFSVASDPCTGATLAPGASCSVLVRFSPTRTAPQTAALSVDTNGGTRSVALRGNHPRSTVTTSGTTPGTSATTTPPTPPTTQTTTPPTTISDQQRLQECERQAQDAEVSYEPSRTMTLDETASLRVVAAVRNGPATTPVSGPVSTTIVPVRLRCEVQAELRGEGFDIKPPGFQQGSFLDRPSIEWSWDVTPRQRGRRFLTLEVRSVAEIDGRRIEGAGGRLFQTDISVGTRPETVGQRVDRWSRAVAGHPVVQGFGSLALVAAAIAGLWRRVLKRPWPWRKTTGQTETPAGAAADDQGGGSSYD